MVCREKILFNKYMRPFQYFLETTCKQMFLKGESSTAFKIGIPIVQHNHLYDLKIKNVFLNDGNEIVLEGKFTESVELIESINNDSSRTAGSNVPHIVPVAPSHLNSSKHQPSHHS